MLMPSDSSCFSMNTFPAQSSVASASLEMRASVSTSELEGDGTAGV
jgi:hypothetical protein